MNTTTRKSGSERQRELREKRFAKGLCRPEVWVYPTDIEKLRAAYPGPRNGVDWQAVIKIALEQAGEQPQLDIKATERKAALLDRLSGFQVEMSGFKFDREEANAR
ncbi:hypothetical protein [Methylomagnum ishizawai]|uniref:hypothetical protein n=1 Tax=Methylomagnum ishizawai TaxID=1760988 RepID=UPI001C323462|nr:hypothetical protein [Methylomagnum ishizawai]BBL77434.1 hypothetical protein MishRS11D_45320 [Methylomagnum ishizawai]